MPNLREIQLRHAMHYRDIGCEADQKYLAGQDGLVSALAMFDNDRNHLELAFERLRGFVLSGFENVVGCDADIARQEFREEAAAILISLVEGVAYNGDLRFHPRQQIRWMEAQCAASRLIRNRKTEGNALTNLGLAFSDLGQWEKAIEFYHQALLVDRELNDLRGEAQDLGNLGVALIQVGNSESAEKFLEQALALRIRIGDRRGEGQDLANIGGLHAETGDGRRALDLCERALAIHKEIADESRQSQDHCNLGIAYARLGDPHQAVQHHDLALAIARRIGDRRGEANTLWKSALPLIQLGETSLAIERTESSLQIYREIEAPEVVEVEKQLPLWRDQFAALAHPTTPNKMAS